MPLASFHGIIEDDVFCLGLRVSECRGISGSVQGHPRGRVLHSAPHYDLSGVLSTSCLWTLPPPESTWGSCFHRLPRPPTVTPALAGASHQLNPGDTCPFSPELLPAPRQTPPEKQAPSGGAPWGRCPRVLQRAKKREGEMAEDGELAVAPPAFLGGAGSCSLRSFWATGFPGGSEWAGSVRVMST